MFRPLIIAIRYHRSISMGSQPSSNTHKNISTLYLYAFNGISLNIHCKNVLTYVNSRPSIGRNKFNICLYLPYIAQIYNILWLKSWKLVYWNLIAFVSFQKSVKVTDASLHYSQISEVYVVPQWDQGQKYFLRIVVPHGSFLIQVSQKFTSRIDINYIIYLYQYPFAIIYTALRS